MTILAVIDNECIYTDGDRKIFKREITKNIKNFISKDLLFQHVCDTVCVNLQYVHLVLKEAGFIKIYFDDDLVINIDVNIGSTYLQKAIDIFKERLYYIDLDCKYYIESTNGYYKMPIKNIKFYNIHGYTTIHLDIEGTHFLTDMSLSDFYLNLSDGVISRVDLTNIRQYTIDVAYTGNSMIRKYYNGDYIGEIIIADYEVSGYTAALEEDGYTLAYDLDEEWKRVEEAKREYETHLEIFNSIKDRGLFKR